MTSSGDVELVDVQASAIVAHSNDGKLKFTSVGADHVDAHTKSGDIVATDLRAVDGALADDGRRRGCHLRRKQRCDRESSHGRRQYHGRRCGSGHLGLRADAEPRGWDPPAAASPSRLRADRSPSAKEPRSKSCVTIQSSPSSPIMFVFGAPVFAFIVSRVLRHQERIEMLRRGIVPPPEFDKRTYRAWRKSGAPWPPPGASGRRPVRLSNRGRAARRTGRRPKTIPSARSTRASGSR